ncbi:MAG TPA: alpha/beta hydrolase [Cyclobacteriaceae bacterium]|nr:alpha/beta hydrolase [Cyclobacteriaceae bacterium]
MKLHHLIVLGFFLLAGCSPKEEKADFTDLETIVKDDDFRAAIKTGNFVKLSDGYTFYEYENKQSDTILVMVHGFSVPSYIWDSTYYAAIKRGYGALRYDTYGRGFSDNPDVNYEVPLFARQLKELLDSLHINKPVNLLGLSDGGRTISVFTALYPERVKNLIYVDAAGFNTMDGTPPASTAVTEEEIQAFKQERYPTMAKGQMSDFYDSLPFRGWDAKYQEVMKYKGFVRALISTQKNRVDISAEQRKIAASGIPVFAIWGEHDTVVKLSDVTANLMERMPAVRLTVIHNAGHLPHMEQTREFNTLLFDNIVSGKP